jgi:dephospho-CoA kinase
MILFIRGLPGSGKTTISKLLAERLQWDVIHADEFKKELMKQNPEANFVKEIVPTAYEKTLEKIQEYKSTNVIVEEALRNKDFVQKLLHFCAENNIKNQWFKILRDKSILLEVNDERKRKVKNTPELLDMFEQQMNDIKIEGEIEVDNNKTTQECFNVILEHVRV